MTEPTFSVVGEAEILRRLAEIARRRRWLGEDFEANENEYERLVLALRVLEAEERDLRRRLGPLWSEA